MNEEQIEYTPGSMAAWAQAHRVEVAELRHSLNIRTLERDTLANALQRLGQRGTHHDLTPTRMLPRTEREGQLDASWEAYLKGADTTVRNIANAALDAIK